MFFNQKFIIYWDTGEVEFVDNLYIRVRNRFDDFYAQMKFSLKVNKPIENFSYCSPYRSFKNPGGAMHDNGFFLYTENGVMISPELLYNEFQIKRNKEFYDMLYRRNMKMHNKRKSHTTTYNKHMRTIAERRAACSVLKEEGEPEFRGTRRGLPDPWDEIRSRKSCSWKDCTKRTKQYKGS